MATNTLHHEDPGRDPQDRGGPRGQQRLYLWLNPLFRRVSMADLPYPSAVVVLLKFGLTAVMAIACFHLIEKPALRLKERFEVRAADPSGDLPAAPNLEP